MDMTIIAIVIIVAFLAQGVAMWFMFGRNTSKGEESTATLLLQKQIENLERSLDSRMSESSKAMNETMRTQLGESSRLIKDITQELTSVKEIGRTTQGFAEELRSLQDILKNPKQRGVLGEYYLETVLKNVLPPGTYKIQYPFKNGDIVDAALFIQDRIIPIDSKFSLENYNRFIGAAQGSPERKQFEKAFVDDLKMRITETAKYIRPDEDTMDFAFMFIPSEGIYYDLLVNSVGAQEEENLLQRAASKYKVIIVSPTSFLAYLQTVLQGLKALAIEEKAVDIQKRVGELAKHLEAYEEYYKKLGNSLSTVVSHYNSGYKELGKIDKDMYRISEAKAGIEPLTLDKPTQED